MLKYLTRILRALLVIILGVGGGSGLLLFIIILTQTKMPNAFRFAITAGMIIGLLVAMVVLAILLPLDLSAHLFLAKGMYKQMWDLEQTRDLVIEGSIKEVVTACRHALLVVPYVTSVQEDIDNLIIYAITSPSWRSSGEKIEVEINPVTDNKWHLKCSSYPRSTNIVFDYGKNFENVETWQNRMIAAKNG